MTQHATPATSDDMLTPQQFSRESRLDPELMTVFIPSTPGPAGPAYRRDQLGIARVVKNMADSGAPAMTIHAAVKDLDSRTPMEVESLGAATTPWKRAQTRRRRFIVAAVAVALVVGIAIGVGAAQATRQDTIVTTTVHTQTVSSPPAQLTPTVPSGRDPVCDEWEQTNRTYRTKHAPWTRIDPKLAAAQWNPGQRAVADNASAVMQDEAQDMRALAGRAENPFLRVLLRAHAVYEDAFALRLRNYQPAKHAHLWRGVLTFTDAVALVCTAPPR